MRSKWFKGLSAAALAVGLLIAPQPGMGATIPNINRSKLNSLFSQAYGNCNRLRALGYNPSRIESQLRRAQSMLNSYWSNPSGFGNFSPAPFGNKQLKTINPFGDYLFHGVSIRSPDGKLQTRTFDPQGMVARAQEWAKQLHGITQQAESGKGSAFNQQVNDALSFLGANPALATSGSLGQQASSQLASLGGGASGKAPDYTGGGQEPAGQFSNPYASDASVVDLRGSKTLTPSLLRDPSGSPVAPGGQGKGATSSASAPQEKAWMDFQKQLFAQKQELDQNLNKMLNDTKAPPPLPDSQFRKVEEGVFLGITKTQYQANELMAQGTSPITGRPYAEMLKNGQVRAFGFGKTDVNPEELMRGALDSQSGGRYTLNQEHFKNLLPQINGTYFEVLNAHSNGTTIATALLKQGVIKAGELNIMGGDRAVYRSQEFQELIDSGAVKKVTVWVNRGDLVPLLPNSPVGTIKEINAGISKLALTMTGGTRGNSNQTKVEYRYFGSGNFIKFLDNHDWNTYRDEMAQERQASKAGHH